MSFESEINQARSNEVDKTLTIEVSCVGPVLEGVGAISSELSESDYGQFGEALRNSIDRIEEKKCLACKDGRDCLQHADGTMYTVRNRVAGGSATPFAMMATGDRNFVEGLD